MISQRAVDLIVSCEVSSKAYYDKVLHRPEWPGGASGVTVGIGYDIGYSTAQKLRADWDGKIPDAMISIMERCCGVTGEAARRLLPSVKMQIDIPWAAAMDVFLSRDIPQWTQTVNRAIPKSVALSADSLGALVSLAYNRGASFNSPGDRYQEMRDIKAHVQNDEDPKVPADFRSMKRLWPNMRGLRDRRDAEAKLFADGLTTRTAPVAARHEINPNPRPVLPPPPAGASEHGTAGGAVLTTVALTNDASNAGLPGHWIATIVIGGIVLSIILWLAVRAYRKSQPTLARAKDAPAIAGGSS